MAHNEGSAEPLGGWEAHGPESNEKRDSIEDYEERRKEQNRIAQRNYRARKKGRQHQNKQGEIEQSPNLQECLEPQGLNSLPPQNLLEIGTNSNENDVPTHGVHDYSPIFREPWAPYDLTKPSTSLDINWSTMSDSIAVPPALHFPYQHSAYLNPLQPTLPPHMGHSINGGQSDPLASVLGLRTPYSSGSSSSTQQQPISHRHDPEIRSKEITKSRRDGSKPSKSSDKHQTSAKPRRKEASNSERGRKGLSASKKGSKQPEADSGPKKAKASSTQQKLLQCAYQQGRTEALALSSKTKLPTLHDEVHQTMDRLVKVYEFGVDLNIFKSDPSFEGYIHAAKRRLPSQPSVRQPGSSSTPRGQQKGETRQHSAERERSISEASDRVDEGFSDDVDDGGSDEAEEDKEDEGNEDDSVGRDDDDDNDDGEDDDDDEVVGEAAVAYPGNKSRAGMSKRHRF